MTPQFLCSISDSRFQIYFKKTEIYIRTSLIRYSINFAYRYLVTVSCQHLRTNEWKAKKVVDEAGSIKTGCLRTVNNLNQREINQLYHEENLFAA